MGCTHMGTTYLFLFNQYSWAEFIYTRCQNVNRKCKGSSHDDQSDHQSKKAKYDPEKHFCPPIVPENEDEVAIQRHITLLQQELSKPKPNLESVASLMQSTFIPRMQWILENVESVAKIVEKYPFFSKAVYVKVNVYA